jgi:hypothetical protein
LSGYGDFNHVDPAIRQSFGVNTVPRRWFDARSGFVVPEGESWWFIHESTPLAPQLAGPLGLDVTTTYALQADLTGPAQSWLESFVKDVQQSEQLVPLDETGVTAVSLPIKFTDDGDSMALVGYKIEPGQATITLLTAWRIEARAYPTRERKIFAHLLADDGTIAAQNDSFAARYETLFPGDIFFQVQAIDLTDLPPGEYWLQIGLYVPSSGERLMAGGRERFLLKQIEVE